MKLKLYEKWSKYFNQQSTDTEQHFCLKLTWNKTNISGLFYKMSNLPLLYYTSHETQFC
jgi:hypothetical protein